MFNMGVSVDSLQCLTEHPHTIIKNYPPYLSDTAMSETKYCKHCDMARPINQFHKDNSSKDGYAFYCKACMAEYGKAYRSTPAGVFSRIKSRTNYYKRNGSRFCKPLNVTRGEFISWYNDEPKVCAYCDIPEEKLYLLQEDFDRRVTRLEIDCMNNEVGYTLNNMALACHLCNFIKINILTFDEMREFSQKHIKPKWEAKLNE